MSKARLLLTEGAFALLLNITAGLLKRHDAIIASKWGWLLFLLHLTYAIGSSEPIKKRARNLQQRARGGALLVLSYVIVGLLGSGTAMLYWKGLNIAYARLFPEEANATVTKGARFSGRQTIEIASVPGEYNRSINLDNVGTLVLGAPFNASTVTLFWPATALSTVVEPVSGKRYAVPGEGEGAIEFGPGVTAKDATIFRHLNQVVFDTGTKQQNLVKVASRIFLVRLEEIKDRATREIPMHFEYTFALSESDPTFENQRRAITADDFGAPQFISAFRDFPQGTIEIRNFRETADSKPNRILMRAGGKIFWCDPSEGLVSFRMSTAAGRSIGLQGQLDRAPEHKDRHFMAVSWDETKGAFLFIDGHLLSDGLK